MNCGTNKPPPVLYGPQTKNRSYIFKCKMLKIIIHCLVNHLLKELRALPLGTQSIKYLLSGPFQKKFADPWSRVSNVEILWLSGYDP